MNSDVKKWLTIRSDDSDKEKRSRAFSHLITSKATDEEKAADRDLVADAHAKRLALHEAADNLDKPFAEKAAAIAEEFYEIALLYARLRLESAIITRLAGK